MGRQRREFTPEYEDEAVKLVISTGRPIATVARELGVKERRWAGESTCSGNASKPMTGPCRRPSGSIWGGRARRTRS